MANGMAMPLPTHTTDLLKNIQAYVQTTTKTGVVTELNHRNLAEDLVAKYHTVFFNNTLFIYDELNRIYVPSTAHIEKEVRAVAMALQFDGQLASAINETLK
jgi:hypothetical protein